MKIFENSSFAPLKILIPCRIIGAIFFLSALFNLFVALPVYLTHRFYVLAVIYAAYVGLNLIIGYGFWGMKKWIVSLSGMIAVIMAVIDISHLIGGAKTYQMFIGFIVLLALFIFSYLSRNFLIDDYKNKKILVSSLILFIISQIAISFFR